MLTWKAAMRTSNCGAAATLIAVLSGSNSPLLKSPGGKCILEPERQVRPTQVPERVGLELHEFGSACQTQPHKQLNALSGLTLHSVLVEYARVLQPVTTWAVAA